MFISIIIAEGYCSNSWYRLQGKRGHRKLQAPYRDNSSTQDANQSRAGPPTKKVEKAM